MKTIYIFVRNDLSIAQQCVQSCHAVLEATRTFITDKERYKIVIFAIKSEYKLQKVIKEATDNGIKIVEFIEPDINQLTTIATEPIDKSLFSRYKLL